MSNERENIAIIGIACRVPGASNYHEFWSNLLEGKESITFFSDNDLRKANVPEHHIVNSNYIKAKGIIGSGEYFDPSFFNISPREATILDPQYRFFLEQAVEALEDAGYYNDKEKDIGVFGGSGTPWHLLNMFKYGDIYNDNVVSIFTGNDKDYLTTRVSYQLDLRGPSVSVQTACSTSLVAVILGVQSILNNQCKMALCGGISLETPEAKGYLYQEGSLNSKDGHCRAFDSKASGTVFSYGSGVVLLKKLSEAIKDRDNIYSIIKGVGLNNDGKSKVGFSAPSIQGQHSVELQAIKSAGINPENISFLEAHGTGTLMGDPIEFEAACKSFNHYTSKKQFCPIVTSKPNIGHTDTAAGVIGLIKASLSLKEKFLPKMINYDEPNPEINLKNSPFYINTENKPLLNKQGDPLFAMVNSFGVGGTNSSVIIQEPLKRSKNKTVRNINHIKDEKHELLVLSAKTESALKNVAANLLNFLKHNKKVNLKDLSYTLSLGRKPFGIKCAIVVSSKEELIKFLKKITQKDKFKNEYINFEISKHNGSPLVFMFPGQGNQYFNMGKYLYEENNIFKTHVDNCVNILKKEYDLDVLKILFQAKESDISANEIDKPVYAQISLFIIEYSLANLLISSGIEPSILVGHSIGEFTAACISGIFSLEDTLKIIFERAKLVESCVKKGSMVAINLSKEKFKEINDLGLDIAVINTPKVLVISGPESDIHKLIEKVKKLKIGYKKLPISHAFHSKMVDVVVEKLYETLKKVKINKSNIPIVSTVNGEFIDDMTTPRYWAEHIRKTVNFSRAITNLHEEYENLVFLEVGPGNSLESAVKQHRYKNSIGTLTNGEETHYKDLISNIGKLWTVGGSIEWEKFYKDSDRYRISLPTYPFERQKFVYHTQKMDSSDLDEKKNESCLYVHSWNKKNIVNQNNLSEAQKYFWVLFQSDTQICNKIYEDLKSTSCQIIIIKKSTKFCQEDRNIYMDPSSRDHYDKLFNILSSFRKNIIKNKSSDGESLRFIFLNTWNLELNLSLNSLNIDKITIEIFYNFVLMLKALISHQNIQKGIKIISLSKNGFEISSEGINFPQYNLLIGPSKVYSRENSNVSSKIIDLEENLNNIPFLSRALILESINTNFEKFKEEIVVYRKNNRWIPTFEYLDYTPEVTKTIKVNSTFIIIGGLGDIGMELANYLYANFKSNLVLVYRSPIPNMKEWDNSIESKNLDELTLNKIRNIKKLKEKGANILLYQGDVCDKESMKNMIEQTLSTFKKINGIFHSAAKPGGGIISLRKHEEFKKVLDPKVKGTLILDEVTQKLDLDFFVMFSSVTAFLGEPGQIDYTSANAFQDAFAKYRSSKRRGHTISINWGKWRSIGMAAKYEAGFYENNLEKINLVQQNKDDNSEIYQIKLFPKKDWIIDEHKLLGIRTLVGTAFIQFIQKIFKKSLTVRGTYLQLENLLFYKPVFFRNHKQKILNCFIRNSTNFIFSDSKNSKEILIGKVNIKNKEKFDDIPIEEIIERLQKEENIDNELEVEGNGEIILSFSSRWALKKGVWLGKKEWLTQLEISTNYLADFEDYPLHPAILDVAFGFCLTYITDGIYLPFSYNKISILCDKLPQKVYSYASLNEVIHLDHDKDKSKNINPEIIDINIKITDESGKCLMVVEGCKVKYLRKAIIETFKAEITKNTQTEEVDPDDIDPQKGIEILFRGLSLPVNNLVIYPGSLKEFILKSSPKPLKIESPKLANPRYNLLSEYKAPTNDMEAALSKIWESILGIEKIGINDNFMELGGNSLIAVQIVSHVNEYFQTDYTMGKFFKDLSIAKMANTMSKDLLQYLNN